MNHGENFSSAITRELHEEVTMEGDFTYHIVDVDEPARLRNVDLIQVRLIFAVTPKILPSVAGSDADEIAYLNPGSLKDSDNEVERRIYRYYERIVS